MKTTLLILISSAAFAGTLDLTRASIVVRPGDLPPAERTAGTVLAEEIEKRTGLRLPVVTAWPDSGAVIAITSRPAKSEWGRALPPGMNKAEGFRLHAQESTVWIIGADPRGALYGAGRLLRELRYAAQRLSLPTPLDVTTSPAYPIRGHQLGYRSTANSWDAWTVPQFEQYIRELAFFGINSIENIPFQDDRKNPLMKVPRREMNRAMSGICRRYGLDYWVWTPATIDLSETARRERLLADFDELFRDIPELTGVFVPGGDPGNNPPELVLPFLADVAKRLKPVHPNARIWLSLQGFSNEKAEVVYKSLDRQVPDWFGGIVAGPSSPPIPETRRRLPAGVRLRLYPDITHNKISQYEVPEWDQAYALTLGREAINPRPFEYAAIHNRFAPMSDGFISYSDGVHDDVNKAVWSALSWDPSRDIRQILIEYCRVFFDSALAEQAADAILALERNWRGSLIANGAVEATLLAWQDLEKRNTRLGQNWRWQMNLLRANYDAYLRRRLIQDTQLETEANMIMAQAETRGSQAAMDDALRVLNQAVQSPAGAELRSRIIELCEQLFHSIGLQTSVEKYHASGAERGAVLDFIDNPLNNRWWLEDEFTRIRGFSNEQEKVRHLEQLAAWENPGPGSYYDSVGHIAKSPHVVRGQVEDSDPLFWWWDQGRSRARLSWQTTLWPKAMAYEVLDTKASYVVRSTGYGQALLRIDGARVQPSVDGREMNQYKEFIVPGEHVRDGKLVLTWDPPTGEGHLNWRQRSRLAEVWLLKR
jgi:hypothetical protein